MLKIDPALFRAEAVAAETAAFLHDLEVKLSARPGPHELPVQEVRRARDEGRGVFPPGGPLDGSDWLNLENGRRLRVSRSAGPSWGIYFHIHGGGWSVGRPSHSDRDNQEIARETGAMVVSAEYRLAPEHRWPAPLEDLRFALDQVQKTRPHLPVILGGESAGAHLAVCLLLDARARGGLGRIRGVCLNYGVFDLRMTASARNGGERDPILSTDSVSHAIAGLVPDPADRALPEISPLLAELSGLPPALFQIGTADPLLDDTLMLAARWGAAGLEADMAVYPGGVHGFDRFDLEIARQFHACQIAFIRGCAG